MIMCKESNEGLLKVEYHLHYVCPTYSVICETYDGVLRECDNLGSIHKAPPRKLSSNVNALFTHTYFALKHEHTLLGKRHT